MKKHYFLKIFLLIILFSGANAMFAQTIILPARNSDTDGLTNVNDSDDDNDGITDATENPCTLPAGASTGQSPQHLKWDTNSNPFPGALETNAVGNANISTANSTITFGSGLNGSDNNSHWKIGGVTSINLAQAKAGNDYIEFRIAVTGGSTRIIELTEWGTYGYGTPPYEPKAQRIAIEIDDNSGHTSPTSLFNGNNPAPNTTNFAKANLGGARVRLSPGTTYFVRVYIFKPAAGDPSEVGLDSFGLNADCYTDTDSDGIPDLEDNDSDNDGCPDAVEGGGNITRNQLDANGQITGAVDGNGIPTAAGGGQSQGTSINATTQDAACRPSATNTVVNTTCPGSTNGSIDVTPTGGLSPYTYQWSGSSTATTQDLTNIGVGTYSVRITDALGQIFNLNNIAVTATNPTPATPTTASVTQPTCSVPTGTIVFNAQAGVQYSINNGTSYQAGTTFSGLAAGTYNLRVRSTAGSCESTATNVTITAAAAAPATPTATVTQPTCSVPTGTIVFTAQTGVQYSIDNGGTYQASATFSNLTAGSYTLRVRSTTDNTCSTAGATVVITAAAGAPATPTATVTQPTCSVTTGTIVFTAPTTGVEYSINNGTSYQASATFNNVAAGTNYTLRVRRTADNTCTATGATGTITAATAPATPTATVTQPTCAASGSIVFATQAGVEYSINNGGTYQTSNTFSNVAAGNYTLRVRSTADNTCSTAGAAVTITAAAGAPATPTATATQPTCAVPTGSIVFAAQTGVEFSINNGGTYQPGATFSNLAAGSYILRVRSTTDNSCSTAGAAVIINAAPTNPPVANPDTRTINEDGPIVAGSSGVGTANNLLTNDTDADAGDTRTITGFTIASEAGSPVHAVGTPFLITGVGTITINANGSYAFAPRLNYNGPVPVFTYTIQDACGLTASSTLTITITPAEDCSTLGFGSHGGPEDTQASISSLGSNPAIQDVDGTLGTQDYRIVLQLTNSIGLLSGTSSGGVTVTGSGTTLMEFTGTGANLNTYFGSNITAPRYTPPADAHNGTGGCLANPGLTATLFGNGGGGTAQCATKNLTLNIAPATDISADNVTACQNTAKTFNVITGVGEVSGEDNFETPIASVTISAINGTAITNGQTIAVTGGSIVVSTDGGIVFTPTTGFTGAATFTYTAQPGTTGCPETANVTVNVNSLPVIGGTTTVNVGQTTQLTGSGTAATTNPWVSSNTGVATVSNTGLVTGIAAGTATITYTNSQGCTATTTVTVSTTVITSCYKLPVTNAGVTLPTKHGITSLGRAGADNSNWPMVRQSAWTVLEAKTKGFVVNRVAFDNGTGNPIGIPVANFVKGMMVYDTTNNCLKIYNGTIWSCYSTPACP